MRHVNNGTWRSVLLLCVVRMRQARKISPRVLENGRWRWRRKSTRVDRQRTPWRLHWCLPAPHRHPPKHVAARYAHMPSSRAQNRATGGLEGKGLLLLLALDILVTARTVPFEGPATVKIKAVARSFRPLPPSHHAFRLSFAVSPRATGRTHTGRRHTSVGKKPRRRMNWYRELALYCLPSLPCMNHSWRRRFHSSNLSSCTVHPHRPAIEKSQRSSFAKRPVWWHCRRSG